VTVFRTLKEYPVIATIWPGTQVFSGGVGEVIERQIEVVLYRHKRSGRWHPSGKFNLGGERYEVAVERVRITNYDPSPEKVREVERTTKKAKLYA
jgi:hypothetical protein